MGGGVKQGGSRKGRAKLGVDAGGNKEFTRGHSFLS